VWRIAGREIAHGRRLYLPEVLVELVASGEFGRGNERVIRDKALNLLDKMPQFSMQMQGGNPIYVLSE